MSASAEPTPKTAMEKRPATLTALLIVFLILGSSGFMTAVIAFPQQFNTREQAMDKADPSKSFLARLQNLNAQEAVIQVQREMAGDMYDRMLPLRPLGQVQTVLNMLLSAALVIFSIAAIRKKAFGRKGLIVTAILHIPFEMLRFIFLYKTAIVSSDAMSIWIGKMQDAQGITPPPDFMPDMGTITGTIMKVQYTGMAIGFLAVYIFTIFYLRRVVVRQQFSS